MKQKRKQPQQENPMTGEIPPEKQIYAVGFIAAMIAQPVSFVERLARLAEVEPCQYINAIPHYRGDAVQAMAAKLAETREAVEDAQAKCAAARNN